MTILCIPSRVDIKGNEKVDKLAKEAGDLPIFDIEANPDWKPQLKQEIHKMRQQKWDEIEDTNKLKRIKTTITAAVVSK